MQRARVLERDLYICQHCGGFGNEVDHINSDAHIWVPDDQLQTLCASCHSRKTMKDLNAGRIGRGRTL